MSTNNIYYVCFDGEIKNITRASAQRVTNTPGQRHFLIIKYSRLSFSRTSQDLIKMFELSVVRDNQIVTSLVRRLFASVHQTCLEGTCIWQFK